MNYLYQLYFELKGNHTAHRQALKKSQDHFEISDAWCILRRTGEHYSSMPMHLHRFFRQNHLTTCGASIPRSLIADRRQNHSSRERLSVPIAIARLRGLAAACMLISPLKRSLKSYHVLDDTNQERFDTVSHEIILAKLNSIGISGKVHQLFQSYLACYSQVVEIGKFQSFLHTITWAPF